MRALFLVAFTALVACNQDYAASNSDRQTFMGEKRAGERTSASSTATATPPAAH